MGARLLLMAGLLLAAVPALARTPLPGAFAAGFTGPVGVLESLAGLLAIGLWAAQNGGPTVWQLPAATLTAALAAGAVFHFGIHLPYAAQGLAGSLVVLGALVAMGIRAPLVVAVLVAAAAALFQGYGQAGGALFWAGYAASLLLLTAAGIGLAAVLTQAGAARAVRMCGGAVALAGILALLGVF